jgi:hypothetical protein
MSDGFSMTSIHAHPARDRDDDQIALSRLSRTVTPDFHQWEPIDWLAAQIEQLRTALAAACKAARNC